jgi:hypothetical protein
MHKTISLLLLCLLLVAVFDPADKIAHMKVPLFVAVWALTAINHRLHRCPSTVPLSLLIYVIGFSFLVPFWSVWWYFSQNGMLDGYTGFLYLKSYLFLTLCIPLVLEKVDLVPMLSFVLTVQAALASLIYVITSNNPGLFLALLSLGSEYDVVKLGSRTYGGAHIYQVFFPTSALLVIPISFFTFKCIASKGRKRLVYLLLLILNVVGLFISGTRNSMIASVSSLLLVWLWYSRRKVVLACLITLLLSIFASMQWSTIQAMMSPDDISNAAKIQHLRDYKVILSDPKTLLLGTGLGGSSNFTNKNYSRGTELTYMELLRNYGILFVVPMLFGLLYPLERLTRHGWKSIHYLYLGYTMYLYLCTADPMLISSTGMLVFSIVLAQTFSPPKIPREASSLDQSYSTT